MDRTLASCLVALFILSGLALALSLQARSLIKVAQGRVNRRQQQLEAELGKLRGCVDELRGRLVEFEEQAEQMVPPQIPSSGFNLNRRTQAIRLLKRGDCPEQVAEALTLPRQEVQLLHRIQQILLSSVDGPDGIESSTIDRGVARPALSGDPTPFQPPVVR